MNVDLGGEAKGPCAGFRVIDFSTVVSGPFCTMILGDLGADVVKIEPPRGDSTRLMGPPFKGGLSALFVQLNRNKRSAVVDLQKTAGREVARKLAMTADVVVQNYRPGVAERIGIDYPTLAAENSKLVYLAISGFGPDGPYRDLPAYDTVIQGLAGHMPLQGGSGEPCLIRNLVADKSTALTGVYGILAALLARERTGGHGQEVHVPMMDAFAAFLLPDALLRDTFVPSDEWQSIPDISKVHRTWETADGHVVIMAVEDAQFRGLCRLIDHEELAGDPRFATIAARIGNWRELTPIAAAAIRERTTADLVRRGRELGVPMAPANRVADFLEDPQVRSNRTVFEVDHAAAGRIRHLRSPVRLRDTPPSFRRHPPAFGEHTDEVLGEAGYSADEITALRGLGAVA